VIAVVALVVGWVVWTEFDSNRDQERIEEERQIAEAETKAEFERVDAQLEVLAQQAGSTSVCADTSTWGAVAATQVQYDTAILTFADVANYANGYARAVVCELGPPEYPGP
jgi:hypothetical protein